jgi:hypothetical protein
MNWIEVGRFLVVAGTVILVLGVVFMFADKIPLGRLPGDIQIGTSKFKIYFPLATSVLLSVVITLLLNFFSKR